MYKPCVRERVHERKKYDQVQKKTVVELKILSRLFVVNANQWLFMQKAFAGWINMKFVKVISKVYFDSFLKCYCARFFVYFE